MGMSTMNPHMNIMPLPKIEDDGPIDLASFTVLKLTIGSWILKGTPKPMQQSDSFYIEAKLTYSGHRIRYEIVQPGSQKVLIIEYDFNQIWYDIHLNLVFIYVAVCILRQKIKR